MLRGVVIDCDMQEYRRDKTNSNYSNSAARHDELYDVISCSSSSSDITPDRHNVRRNEQLRRGNHDNRRHGSVDNRVSSSGASERDGRRRERVGTQLTLRHDTDSASRESNRSAPVLGQLNSTKQSSSGPRSASLSRKPRYHLDDYW